MRYDGWYPSCGEGRIHYIRWVPEGIPIAVLQIIHGVAEKAERYEEMAAYFNTQGYVVAAEDHMGHGQSRESAPGYFKGGWDNVVKDTMTLTELLKKEYKELPFAYYGHSMGSFLLRTILCRNPRGPYDAAVISGTGWHARCLLPQMEAACRMVCRKQGERTPSPFLNKMVFGNYNARVEHVRTEFDWLTRNRAAVDRYLSDPDCGFVPPAGLFLSLTRGLRFIENRDNLRNMRKDLPVLLVSGSMDPVGDYGRGVRKTEFAFLNAGMEDVSMDIYPLCRHELINEINRQEIFEDLSSWLDWKILKEDVL